MGKIFNSLAYQWYSNHLFKRTTSIKTHIIHTWYIYHIKLLGTSHSLNSHILCKKGMQHLCTPHYRKTKQTKKLTIPSLENGQNHLKRSLVAILNAKEPCRKRNRFFPGNGNVLWSIPQPTCWHDWGTG